MTVLPDRDLAYIAYTNAVTSERAIVGLRDAVVGAGFPLDAREAPSALPAPDAVDLDAFVGTYRTLTKDVVVTRRDGALFLQERARQGDYDVDPTYAAGTGRGLPAPVVPVAPDRLDIGAFFLEPDPAGRFGLISLRNRIARRVTAD